MSSAVIAFRRWRCAKGAPLLLALFSLAAVAQTVVEVRIVDYRFEPPTLSIKLGDSVRWINGEKRTSHSVLFPDENSRESERLFPGEHWERRFDRPGRYAYQCGPHPEMKGEVLVGE
ncbi:MAG: cupredoxin domain-containing protein [Betaproteobacteria bacterium]|nr:cupredoxin domain-containing protein [Betaproteobacteria bacterium]